LNATTSSFIPTGAVSVQAALLVYSFGKLLDVAHVWSPDRSQPLPLRAVNVVGMVVVVRVVVLVVATVV
jgi:hypothetical protein